MDISGGCFFFVSKLEVKCMALPVAPNCLGAEATPVCCMCAFFVCFCSQDLEPSQLLAYDVADHTDAPMDTGGEKPDLGDRYPTVEMTMIVESHVRSC